MARGERGGRRAEAAARAVSSRRAGRHGRRAIRSSLTGPQLPNPDTRTLRFELAARAAIEVLRAHLGSDLEGVNIGFVTVPNPRPKRTAQSEQPMYYSIDRAKRTILLHRMPIQRAKVLHVNDEFHRHLFIEHCVHRAVCEYLGRSPWEIMPGRFDHF